MCLESWVASENFLATQADLPTVRACILLNWEILIFPVFADVSERNSPWCVFKKIELIRHYH